MTILSARLLAATLCCASVTAHAEETKAPAYPVSANGDGAVSNGYSISRWAEDWRVMASKARRDDPLDRLKFLPLTGDDSVYLTLSGELRLRMNQTTNPNLREGEAQRQDISRVVAGADLHVGPHLRFYGELAHGGLGGENLGKPSSNFRNGLAAQQYFAEVSEEVGGLDVGIRYGRQEFVDGPNLLTSQRDNNTMHYTLNGVRAWVRGKAVRADVFDFRPTAYGEDGLRDDKSDPERRFSGVTLGYAVPPRFLGGSKLFVDPFLWRRQNGVGAWGGRVGPATRYYGGVHVYGDAGPVNLDWTVNHQWGSFIDQRIDAWQVLLAQSLRLGADKAAPRVGLSADYASGGGGYGDGKLRDAYSPFGNNVYFSYQLYLTPTNLRSLAPTFSFSPLKAVKVSAEYRFAWRDSVTDAVYRANGQAFAGTQNGRARKIAELARLQAVWTISPRVTFTGRYEHLQAGPALTSAGYRSSDFLAGWLSLRF
ncbi:alginate export family protein [Novosphingobium clariflavum]|uniref:Alginate export family protein n=1 Tax=Novosphingobium clariflavum TaxID=2029884 RepID=A0ABV6S8F3_9SPHN|nr:alginate export family protein [Novosphingobium clariflavum]